jgi:serine phosphatase RsbU (regulator of sigma subunit)
MPLGILPDITFTEEIVPLDGCKSALLYTDGLTEARNPHGELFGEERLLNWLKQEASRKLTAAQLSENFLAELKSFQSSVSLNDDQTFLILAEDTVATQADTPAATTPIVRVAARAQNVSRFSPARS